MSGRRITSKSSGPRVAGDAADPSLAPPTEFVPLDAPEDRIVVDSPPEEQSVEEVQEDPVTELTEEERRMFSTLLTCGRRSREVDVMGHRVVVHSLCSGDDLRIGLFAKDYVGSFSEQRAYQIGVAAAGLRQVDGREFYQPLSATPSEDEVFDAKVAKVKEFTPVVVAQIYREILALEKEFVELATKLGKLSG